MGNYVGKCFLLNGQLIKVTSEYSTNPTYKNYYTTETITPIIEGYGIGHKLSSVVYYINEYVQQVDSTIWDKTIKLIKLGNSVCIALLSNAPASPVYTGYTKLVYDYSNIVKVISDNRSLFITPDHFSILYNHKMDRYLFLRNNVMDRYLFLRNNVMDRYLFLRNNVVAITSTANISKDVYNRVYENIVNTTNEIKKLWI